MRNHFYRFPGVDNDKDKTLSAMLRMAVIAQTQERYEKAPVETDEQRAEKAALEGLVKQLFGAEARLQTFRSAPVHACEAWHAPGRHFPA